MRYCNVQNDPSILPKFLLDFNKKKKQTEAHDTSDRSRKHVFGTHVLTGVCADGRDRIGAYQWRVYGRLEGCGCHIPSPPPQGFLFENYILRDNV